MPLRFSQLALTLSIIVALCGSAHTQTFQTVYSWSARPTNPVGALCKGSDGALYGVSGGGGGDGDGTVFRVSADGVLTVIHSFVYSEGYLPAAGLVQGPDGTFYGTTSNGGSNGVGTIYKITSSGEFSVLLDLQKTPAAYTKAPLILGQDGNFYGTSTSGNTTATGSGTVYKVTPTGEFTLLHSFTGTTGKEPNTRLLQGSDGNLYGTARRGGTNDFGTVFRVRPNGTTTVLYNFSSADSSPSSALTFGADGNLYGTTETTFYRITPQGDYAPLYSFAAATGNYPRGDLVLASDGFLYGATIRGGAKGYGVVYRINTAGQFSKLTDFTSTTDFASVIESAPGVFTGLMGSSSGTIGSVFRVTSQGQFTSLSTLSVATGTTPTDPLIEVDNGALFGTTSDYNTSSGLVFRVSSEGNLSVLTRGGYLDSIGTIRGGVTKGQDGFLYGTTGGSASNNGAIYKIAQTGGTATVLKSLTLGSEGAKPKGRLVQAGDGNFYGVTSESGNGGFGTVFKITPTGTFTTIATFNGTTAGKYPNGTLTPGADGNLYGTTDQGGSSDRGTVFRVTPGATPTFSTLVTFINTNGQTPTGVLMAAPDGNIYGTTLYGGTNNSGTFFRITPAGVHTVIASTGSRSISRPRGAIAIGKDGNFYGVTSEGGTANRGSIYRLTPSGTLTVLHSFTATTPNTPMNGLTVGVDGNFYGTTTVGGLNGIGSAFRITPEGVISHFRHFDYRTGNTPVDSLFRASDERIYGLNETSGTGGGGTLFVIEGRPFISAPTTESIAATTATLKASVNPNGNPTTVEFYIGNTSYGTATVPAGNTPVTVQKVASGLNPHTTYSWTATATNAFGTQSSTAQSFATLNRAPEARDDRFHSTMAPVMELRVLDSDSDLDGDPLTITGVTQGQHGEVSTDGTKISYKPAADYIGNDSFTYTISDGFQGVSTATVTLENRAPVASTDDVHLPAAPTNIDVLHREVPDTDADGDPLTISSVTNGQHGTVTTDGSAVLYTPGEGYDGNDSFTYTISDGYGGSSTATIRLRNTAPVAVDDVLHAPVGLITIDALKLGSPDSDADGDSLTITAVTNGTHGTVTINGATLTYTPGSTYIGRDVFTYTISDGFGGSSTGTVNLQNTGVKVLDLSLHLHSKPVVIAALTLGASGPDPDGDTLFLSAVTNGQKGTVAIDEANVVYTPAAGYDGNDTFTYTISDGFGWVQTGKITLTNALPVPSADLIVTNGEAATISPRSNDTDADDQDLLITAVTQGVVGTVTFDSSGMVTYTPGPRFFGRDTFTYTVTDGSASASATVMVRNSQPVVLSGPLKDSQIPDEPEGSVYGNIDLSSSGIFSGEVQNGRVRQRAIFAADGSVLLKVGDPAPEISGATIAALGKPSGQAVVATIKGAKGSGITAANDTVLYAGLSSDSVRAIAREGVTQLGGATLKSILSADGNGASVFFLAKLAGRGVKASNDVALCVASEEGAPQVLVREGDIVDGKAVTSIATLASSTGTAAEGRWRSGAGAIGVRLSFPGKAQTLYTIPADATTPADWTRWSSSGEQYTGAGTVGSFGLPGFGPASVAFTAQLARGDASAPEVVTASNDSALVRVSADESVVLAREGGAVPDSDGVALPAVQFQKLSDPVSGTDGRTAFAATLAGSGVKANNRSGLWLANSSGAVRLLARAGDQAPDGSRWAAFESLVFPDGAESGPVFTAKLVADSTTPKNSRALWAMDSAGDLKLLLRTGQSVPVDGGTRTVKSFVALSAASGSAGAASGFDDDQHVSALVTFTDGTQALINIAVP